MKIYEIWEKIKNESLDVKDMALASLNGQLEVRFRQVVYKEIRKLGVVYGNEFIADYYDLKFWSDGSLKIEGLDKNSDLMLNRELIIAVDTVRTDIEDDYGNPSDDIDIEAVFENSRPSEASMDLLPNIMEKVYDSEFIDIDGDSTCKHSLAAIGKANHKNNIDSLRINLETRK